MYYFCLFFGSLCAQDVSAAGFCTAVTQTTSVAAPAHRVEMLSLFSDQWGPELVIDLSGSSSEARTGRIRGG